MTEILKPIYMMSMPLGPAEFMALLGIVVGVITLIISLSRNRALSRTQHTFNALLEMSFNDRYQAALSMLRPYLHRHRALPQDLYSPSDQNEELRNALSLLLNYYEFLAGGLRHGALSEPLLREDQEFLVLNLYGISGAFIASRREELGRPALFRCLEWLHGRWACK